MSTTCWDRDVIGENDGESISVCGKRLEVVAGCHGAVDAMFISTRDMGDGIATLGTVCGSLMSSTCMAGGSDAITWRNGKLLLGTGDNTVLGAVISIGAVIGFGAAIGVGAVAVFGGAIGVGS